MSELFDAEEHELVLGQSFNKSKNSVGFHSMRCDFKPASVDPLKRATVEIGSGHQVSLTVPHVEGSGTDSTVFKGNKRPLQKECVLIIDHTTGEFILEKLSTNIQLKKTRTEGSSKAQHVPRPITPVDQTKPREKTSPSAGSKKAPPQSSNKKATAPPPPQSNTHASQKEMVKADVLVGDISDSSSSGSDSSDSGSDSEEDTKPKVNTALANSNPMKGHTRAPGKDFGMLTQDLQLSESGSDSD